ncbi:cupin domain-containing protein [soil metagenome]
MTTRLLADSAGILELSQVVAPGTSIEHGEPTASVRELAGFNGHSVGIWEMTPGAARDVESDELFVVVSGRGTVSFHDGESIELAPGTVVRLHAGDQTLWTIVEPLRKVYFSPAE